MTNLYSVDVVLTPNEPELWTRCIVLEACEDNALSIGGAYKQEPRKSPSVDKNGNPDGSGTTGMGWFPGYAINVETGERLNIMFSENSADTANNGDIVVALVDDSATVKRFYKRKNKIILRPENDRMKDMEFDNVIILGVVKGLLRKF